MFFRFHTFSIFSLVLPGSALASSSRVWAKCVRGRETQRRIRTGCRARARRRICVLGGGTPARFVCGSRGVVISNDHHLLSAIGQICRRRNGRIARGTVIALCATTVPLAAIGGYLRPTVTRNVCPSSSRTPIL